MQSRSVLCNTELQIRILLSPRSHRKQQIPAQPPAIGARQGANMVIPYVAGMSEDTRFVCRKFNIRVVYACRNSHLQFPSSHSNVDYAKAAGDMIYHIRLLTHACSCKDMQY